TPAASTSTPAACWRARPSCSMASILRLPTSAPLWPSCAPSAAFCRGMGTRPPPSIFTCRCWPRARDACSAWRCAPGCGVLSPAGGRGGCRPCACSSRAGAPHAAAERKRSVARLFPASPVNCATSISIKSLPVVTTLPPRQLPDVAGDVARAARPLDWVGMQRIAVPIRMPGEGDTGLQVPASVDIAVDLRDPDARGIHMSRLYLKLQDALTAESPSHAGLGRVLQECIDSQQGLSTRARIAIRYQHMLRRAALASDSAGWKSCPVEVIATLDDGQLAMDLAFSVEYSSTCPASAALSRQLNAERFAADFANDDQ